MKASAGKALAPLVERRERVLFSEGAKRKLSEASATRQKRARGAWRLLRALVLCVSAWSLVAWGAAEALIVRRDLPHADALVVFGGSAAYVERTQFAARLFHAGRAPRIILTNDNLRGGWSQAEQRNPYFYERAAEELKRAGVPSEKIEVLPQTVTTTYEEAALLRDYAASHDLRALLFVTSAYHTRRACWTLSRVLSESGIEFGLDAPAPGQGQSPAPATWWLHLHGWRAVAWEYPKLVYYRIHYR
jgi:uncharacterized SAM-binding protein YcdF (DUF218 family)